ncbi:bifunctional diaminohydroxyphosphoribosylaminopyrimidine deaminase/5-amino-6-(5-phosphoribosylamino)uracil reductase RibD [Allohahella marinimesophila]|uniref:Riboflavin biosynthesis protein RibD n=1 Tax=Allohahella marinimesophila TaxID=1054972 RepID=A0ABP7PTX1_9GAMM
MTSDELFMQAALQAALKGRFTTSPNPRVGCVFVRNAEIISTGWHMRRGGAHAELAAMQQARDRGVSLEGTTCFVTLEPCSHFGTTPPCANALIEAGVARVVAACEDPNPLVSGRGFNVLRAAGVDVTTGVLAAEARALNPGFFSRMQRNRPYVRVKIAASLDGRTALSNGASKWITQSAAREDVHRLRALSSVVLTGAGTVRADDPMMTVRSEFVARESEGEVRQPLRVVLAGQQPVPLTAKIFQPTEAATLLVRSPGSAVDSAEAGRVAVMECAAAGGGVDLTELLNRLALEHHCNELLVEAGPMLASRFLAEGLCDELWWYSGAILLGADARAAIEPLNYQDMAAVDRLSLRAVTRVGNDTRTILSPDSDQAAAANDLQTDLYHWTIED